MADLTRTYTGPLARGRVQLDDRSPQFQRGVPLEVSEAEAVLLDKSDEWTKPKRAPKSQGSEPNPKES